MVKATTSSVLGVDGCRGGWIGVRWDGTIATTAFATSIKTLIDEHAGLNVTVVGIDMPMGLPDVGTRQADRLAQRELGRRSSSIFVTPTRAALAMTTQPDVSAANKLHGGPGVSIQAFHLRPKVLEVDEFLRHQHSGQSPRLVEVHPELSFQEMNGGPVSFSKRTAEGLAERRAILARFGIDIETNSAVIPGSVAADDVLDAAAAAWSAWRVHQERARSLPAEPEINDDGIAAAIWV